MKRIDYHCHFSGSLSANFLSERIPQSELYSPIFTPDWEQNFQLFFQTYLGIQRATKSSDPISQTTLYESGAFDICSSYINEGVDEFHLRMGPRVDLTETRRRLESTMAGFNRAEKRRGKDAVGKIVLTLIHDKTGKFFNTNADSLKQLLTHLEKSPEGSDRVIGFDFSGPEDNFDQKELFSLLEILTQHNRLAGCRKYEIAVHAGEYVDRINITNQFDYLDLLLTQDINRISHGTIIWLDPVLVDPKQAKEIQIRQQRLLTTLATKNIHLEICPTGNTLLSPLIKPTDIPLADFDRRGIRYSINTDNKTIFNTTLHKEWNYFSSNIANPFDTAVKGSNTTILSPKIVLSAS